MAWRTTLWLAHYAVVGKILVQDPLLSLNLMTNAVAICQIIITQPFPEVVRREICKKFGSTYQVTSIMLSIVHAPHPK